MERVTRVPRGRSPAGLLAGLVTLIVILSVYGAAGCSLLMDLDTDGYHPAAQAGASDGACPSDGACFRLNCAGAMDCPSGQICCATATTSSIAAACENGPTCSGAASVELCTSATECAGSQCIAQACTLPGVTGFIRACNLIGSVCVPAGD